MPHKERVSSSDSARPRRRQNKSCDQCRQGKRRCDVELNAATAGTSYTALKPCTNCVKWRKPCTVGWIKWRQQQRRYQPTGFNRPAYGAVYDDVQCGLDDASLGFSLADAQYGIPNIGLPVDDGCLGLYQYDANQHDAFNIASGDQLTTPSLSSVPTISSFNDQAELFTGGPDPVNSPDGAADPALDTLVVEAPLTESDLSQPVYRGVPFTEPAASDACSTSSVWPYSFGRAASPITSQFLVEDHSRLTIKKGLVKIYHDSMEGALSCWLTERNCPYSSTLFDGSETWSSKWANRIVTRVCDLDHAYATAISVAPREQQQAARVLNLVIMAFSSQWSQTGDATSLVALQECDGGGFERNMQSTLWHQANKALFEASENTSFRVILAGIVFSLTQCPLPAEDLCCPSSQSYDHLDHLNKILEHDGPPLALDIVLRKLQDHQRQLQENNRPLISGTGRRTSAMRLSDTHKQTFGLLYWLAVMFDSLSAAINRRPFAVSNDESSFLHDDEPPALLNVADDRFEMPSVKDAECVPVSGIWGGYFLEQHSRAGDIRQASVRWPCYYNDAAACLADAAPVKVLLFRRVAQLQSLVYRRSSAGAVESGIDAALEVYTHWNSTYGLFIEDCIQYHEALPARIQSWYTLLAGHWNLAVLILADLIQDLDERQRTAHLSRRNRLCIDLCGTMRARAVFAISELGRCSRLVDGDLTFSQSPDFHHAVNKAALLTEPWTMVLVRAFGYAGAILSRQVTDGLDPALQYTRPDRTIRVRERLQYCIDALHLLGRKSDTAKCAAKVLQRSAATPQNISLKLPLEQYGQSLHPVWIS